MKKTKHIAAFSCLLCIFVGAFILSFTSPSMATTYCVANETDLIAALNNATNNGANDIIKIQQGTYYGNFVYASTESFGVTIEGGYRDALCTVRDVNPNNTVFDGEQNGAVLVFSTPDMIADFTVDGLTLQNGNVNIQGGGLFALTNGTVTLTNNTISDNSAKLGGGIYFHYTSGSLTLINNTIINNSALNGGGAFINSSSGTVTLTNNTISDNSAELTGGGIYINSLSGTVTLTNNTISGNSSSSNGGGIYVFKIDTFTLTNNTIINNNANNFGGGFTLALRDDSDIANIYNNIILNNYAGDEGGGLYIENDVNNNYFPSTVNLFNNDFNQSEDGIYIQIDFPIDSNNLDNVDPSFVDPATDDYHLNVGSPCINAGDNDAPEIPDLDKDGNPRIMDGIVDMGAFEYPGAALPIIDSFIASPTSGEVPLTVNFTCVAHDFGGSIASYTFDYDDGSAPETNDTGMFSHTYDVFGSYEATCTAEDNDGNIVTSDPVTINVTEYQNRPPVADAGDYMPVFDIVTLDGSGCSDPDGTVEFLEWNLLHEAGSTCNREATGESPTVTDLCAGYYTVTVLVTDDGGAIATDTTTVAAAGLCGIEQCLSDLTQCQINFGLCSADLTQCSTDLTEVLDTLAICSGNLSRCDDDLYVCQIGAEQCNSSLSQCSEDLSQAEANLQTCTGNLAQVQQELVEKQAELETTQSQLEQALADLAEAVADADGDGLVDIADACSDTLPGSAVDQIGCSLAQFCGAIDASTRDGIKLCKAVDWQNDEPLGSPKDCKALKQGKDMPQLCAPALP